ncbi:MAG: hypothetical protein EPN97_15200 [Alphaproteobacteria bacterium]|nr:MAG: hypothetical protein EPN97_15200 [Alphaproteobacteria bacterium]
MKKLFQFLAIATMLAFCAAGAHQGLAQGYKGLIPDNTGDQGSENTYGGAIAPSAKPKNNGTKKEPQGYKGLIPGHVAPAQTEQEAQTEPGEEEGTEKPAAATKRVKKPATAATPAGARPRGMSTGERKMSSKPGYENRKMLTADDLKQLSAMTGIEIRLDQMPENMANAIHMPPHVYPVVSLPQPRIDGMLPVEFSAKQMIDKLMKDIETAPTAEAREKVLSDSISALSNFASGMRVRRDMPQELYTRMGVPENFVTETREGSSKAAKRLEDAIKILKKM